MSFNSRPLPILLVSDSPDLPTGLARICRHLAGLLSSSPFFRVGTLGLGGQGSRRLPWQQYTIQRLQGEWGQGSIREVWADFAGRERGVIMPIWDATRVFWLARPEYSGDVGLLRWRQEGHFDLWGYLPIDATGPGRKLTGMAQDALLGFQRLLCYTKWAQGLVEASIGQEAASQRDLTWLPHGMELERWPLRDKEEARSRLYPFLHEGQRLVGVVATNQPRKDWGLVASVCRELALRDSSLRFWWHVDLDERYWSIPALVNDFGLGGRVQVTHEMSNAELSWRYNACDLTLHPGLGEGFGYPIFESLASGVPVLHGNYGGGAEVMAQCGHEEMLVQAEGWRIETIHNNVRPVFHPNAWLAAAEESLGREWDRMALRASLAHLDWQNLWPSCWLPWFMKGREGFQR